MTQTRKRILKGRKNQKKNKEKNKEKKQNRRKFVWKFVWKIGKQNVRFGKNAS